MLVLPMLAFGFGCLLTSLIFFVILTGQTKKPVKTVQYSNLLTQIKPGKPCYPRNFKGVCGIHEFDVSPEKVEMLDNPFIRSEQYWIYNPMTGQTARRYSQTDAEQELNAQATNSNHPVTLFKMVGWQVGTDRHRIEKDMKVSVDTSKREIEELKREVCKLKVDGDYLTRKLTDLMVKGK